MEYIDRLIISIIQENGANSRILHNDEAYSKIVNLVWNELNEIVGQTLSEGQLKEKIKEFINRKDYIDTNYNRPNASIEINENGDITINERTKTDPYRGERNAKHVFSFDKNTEDVIISSAEEYLLLREKASGDTRLFSGFGSTTVSFTTYNKHGLEMQKRSIEQSYELEREKPIRHAMDIHVDPRQKFFDAKEEIIERRKDLASIDYKEFEAKGMRVWIDKNLIIERHKDRSISSPRPFYMELGGQLEGDMKAGVEPIASTGEKLFRDPFGVNASLSKEEMEQKVKETRERLIYYNKAFRDTVLEDEKGKDEVVEAVDKFAFGEENIRLVLPYENLSGGKVSISDLEQIYRTTDNQEIQSKIFDLLHYDPNQDDLGDPFADPFDEY